MIGNKEKTVSQRKDTNFWCEKQPFSIFFLTFAAVKPKLFIQLWTITRRIVAITRRGIVARLLIPLPLIVFHFPQKLHRREHDEDKKD
jgi:hypothetical protein